MTTNTRALGAQKEELAAEFLEKEGLEIVERNFRCRQGEVDIIAYDGDTLCFIEVKYRSSLRFGYPEESVTPKKQQRICRTSLYYIYSHHIQCNMRYDVVSILPDRIRYIRNAFEYR